MFLAMTWCAGQMQTDAALMYSTSVHHLDCIDSEAPVAAAATAAQ